MDIAAFGAAPGASTTINDAAIALAVAQANASGGVLTARLKPGAYDFAANIPPLTTAAGIDMAGSIFRCTAAGQTGAFLTIGSLLLNGHQNKVLRGVRVQRATLGDWSDESQVGVLLRCLQNTTGTIDEAQAFTTGVRLAGMYDGTTAADAVHNTIDLGRIWRCKYAFDFYSDSPADFAGAPNNNRVRGGDLTAVTGENTGSDRFGICFRTRTWFSGTITANAATNEVTLGGGGSVPVNGRLVFSNSGGALPAGLTAGVRYYVVASAGSVVKVSLTLGGAEIDITDAGTGTHSAVAKGYQNHNANEIDGVSFQHARPGAGSAYCVLSEVDATQNTVKARRAEWTAPAVMRGTLTKQGGGNNDLVVDLATSYLTNELTDVVDAAATKAAWRTINLRYSKIAHQAHRPILVIPNLRATLFADYRDGPISYGFDDLHIAYTSTPAGGVGVATIATCVLRNDQRASLSGGQGIVPAADSITIGAARGIGTMIDTNEGKWIFPVATQAAGARTGRWAVRCFDAAGVLLGSGDRVLLDHPSMTMSWNATSLCWQVTADQTDANQAGRLALRVPDTCKAAQVMLLYPGADIAAVQSLGFYTPDPYPMRAYPGVAGGTRELVGTAAWDPPNVADGAQAVQTATVAGAAFGDAVTATLSLSIGNQILTGYIQGADTPAAVLQNESGGALNLASATLTLSVLKARVP